MAQSRLSEWSDSGHSRERLIWHEKWTENIEQSGNLVIEQFEFLR